VVIIAKEVVAIAEKPRFANKNLFFYCSSQTKIDSYKLNQRYKIFANIKFFFLGPLQIQNRRLDQDTRSTHDAFRNTQRP